MLPADRPEPESALDLQRALDLILRRENPGGRAADPCVRLELLCAHDFGGADRALACDYRRTRKLHQAVPALATRLGVGHFVGDSDSDGERHSDAYLYFRLSRCAEVFGALRAIRLPGDILDVPPSVTGPKRAAIAREFGWRVEVRADPCGAFRADADEGV